MSEDENKGFTGTMRALANDLVDSIQYADCLSSLDELLASPRGKVYAAIDGERDYQDSLPASRTDGSQKSVGDYITMMGAYYDRALQAWACSPGNEEALHVMRKLAAIAVRCMEEHGAPERVAKQLKPKDPVHFEPSGSWYFYDETWSDRLGPYGTEEDAREGLAMYCAHLDGKPYKRVPLATFTDHTDGEERRVSEPRAPFDKTEEYDMRTRKVPRYEDQPGNITLNINVQNVEELRSRGQTMVEAKRTAEEADTVMLGGTPRPKPVHERAMDAYGFVDGDKMEWLDLRNEESREYIYPDGVRYRVEQPLQINIKRGEVGDSHRIRTKSGRGVYVAPGWLAVEWVGYNGKDATAF